MMRYVWNGETFVPLTWQPPAPRRTPMIIRDHMEPVQHPCTGETLDSKSAFRAITRAHGCVELGNDAPPAPRRREVNRAELRQDIATALTQVEQGYRAPEPARVTPDARIYKEPPTGDRL